MKEFDRRDAMKIGLGVLAGVAVGEAVRPLVTVSNSGRREAIGVAEDESYERVAEDLLESIDDPPIGQYQVTTFTINCMEGGSVVDRISFCDTPRKGEDISIPNASRPNDRAIDE